MSEVVILLSGGLDSYTAAAILKAERYQLNALSVRYGQRHVRELDAARRVASAKRTSDARRDASRQSRRRRQR